MSNNRKQYIPNEIWQHEQKKTLISLEYKFLFSMINIITYKIYSLILFRKQKNKEIIYKIFWWKI